MSCNYFCFRVHGEMKYCISYKLCKTEYYCCLFPIVVYSYQFKDYSLNKTNFYLSCNTLFLTVHVNSVLFTKAYNYL